MPADRSQLVVALGGAALWAVACIELDDLKIEVARADSPVQAGGAPSTEPSEPDGSAGSPGAEASPRAGASTGPSESMGGARDLAGIGGDGAGFGATAAGGEGTVAHDPRPQCASAERALRSVFAEDFEKYADGSPYAQDGSPWVQAKVGRDALVLESAWAHSGVKSFVLFSYTTRSEMAYVPLELNGPPRRVVIELWYTPSGSLVYLDFAELGLANARSRFDLQPTVAFEVNDHTLELRADPEQPIASTNGAGQIEPAAKPPAQKLFDEVLYAVCAPSPEPPSCPAIHNYVRLELDFCADAVRAFVGADENAPLVGSGSFDGARPVNAFYLAGGLNSTYVDDLAIRADDG